MRFSLKDKKKHVSVTIFVLSVSLKMTTTGLFPGHRALTGTATLGSCKPVKAMTSVSGFPGLGFESLPPPGGFSLKQSQAFIPFIRLYSQERSYSH